MAEGEKIIQINISDEMKSAYIDYSMSVIVSRALPDVRDGLKPVHRRVLYGMLDLGRVVKPTLQESPQGSWGRCLESTTLMATARCTTPWCAWPSTGHCATPWWMAKETLARLTATTLPPCVTRRPVLRKVAEDMLSDLDKETVDFRPNFDESLKEPTVLPSPRFQTCLVNGAAGIAVGMATNMPPHNLTEVVEGMVHLVDNPDCTVED